jgi:hypothetical protein
MLQQFFIQSPNRAMQRTAGRRGGPCAVALGKMCIKQREHPSMDVLRAGPDNFLAKIKIFRKRRWHGSNDDIAASSAQSFRLAQIVSRSSAPAWQNLGCV